jgi:hypothetical protein
MVAIVRTEWDGTSGGPGLTQFALIGGAEMTAGNAQSAVNAVRKFWNSLASYLPDELRLQVSPIVDIYRETDAELLASVVAPVVPLNVIGGGTTGYAGGAGIKINWNTGVIRNGRRVKGSVFIVPALATSFGNTGIPTPGTQLALNNAATTLMSDLLAGGTALAVWSRPLVVDKVITRAGAISGVVSGTVAPKSAILRGRRD